MNDLQKQLAIQVAAIKQNYSDQLNDITDKVIDLKKQIADYELKKKQLKKELLKWNSFQKGIPFTQPANQPLTRTYLKNYLAGSMKPRSTIDLVDALYLHKTPEERSDLIKKVSSLLQKMQKDNEIEIIKVPGQKGNLYEIKK